jgi:hypothetical protein
LTGRSRKDAAKTLQRRYADAITLSYREISLTPARVSRGRSTSLDKRYQRIDSSLG